MKKILNINTILAFVLYIGLLCIYYKYSDISDVSKIYVYITVGIIILGIITTLYATFKAARYRILVIISRGIFWIGIPIVFCIMSIYDLKFYEFNFAISTLIFLTVIMDYFTRKYCVRDM